jgi:hypothetical protein
MKVSQKNFKTAILPGSSPKISKFRRAQSPLKIQSSGFCEILDQFLEKWHQILKERSIV